MFAGLKEKAAKAAADAAAQVQQAAADVKSRVDTAQAGKKLLDEGGEPGKVKLLGKQATLDAHTLDFGFSYNVQRVIKAYRDAVPLMQTASALGTTESKAFKDLSESYTKRADELEKIKLQALPAHASISAAETDAINIICAKANAAGMHAKARSSISAAMGSGAAPDASAAAVTDTNEVTNDVTPAAPADAAAPKTLMDKAKEKAALAQEKAKLAADRVKERAGNANAGKTMVDQGGEEVTAVLLAKEASLYAVQIDGSTILGLAQAGATYKDAQEKLQESLSQDGGTENPSFDMLVASCGLRFNELESVLEKLSAVPDPIAAHESETDGIAYLRMHMEKDKVLAGVGASVNEVQGRMAEQAMSGAVSGATGGAVTQVPEGSGKAAVQFAKENPEQAKAAMSLAADVAKTQGGKGGGYS